MDSLSGKDVTACGWKAHEVRGLWVTGARGTTALPPTDEVRAKHAACPQIHGIRVELREKLKAARTTIQSETQVPHQGHEGRGSN